MVATPTTTPTTTNGPAIGPTTVPDAAANNWRSWGTSEWTYSKPDEVSEIEEGILLSGFLEYLPAGVDAVVNVSGRPNTWPRWQDDLLTAELFMPLNDTPRDAPSVKWLDSVVDSIVGFRHQKLNVLIHCGAGISRSGMVTVAYLMQTHNWTRDRALRVTQAKRQIVHPNPGFMDSLAAFERHLGIKGTPSHPLAVSGLPMPGTGHTYAGCPGCGHWSGHAGFCRLSDKPADASRKRNPIEGTASITGKASRPVAYPATEADAAEDDEAEDLGPFCHNCDQPEFGIDGAWTLLADFEDDLWCASCLQDEQDHRDALAKAKKEADDPVQGSPDAGVAVEWLERNLETAGFKEAAKA